MKHKKAKTNNYYNIIIIKKLNKNINKHCSTI